MGDGRWTMDEDDNKRVCWVSWLDLAHENDEEEGEKNNGRKQLENHGLPSGDAVEPLHDLVVAFFRIDEHLVKVATDRQYCVPLNCDDGGQAAIHLPELRYRAFGCLYRPQSASLIVQPPSLWLFLFYALALAGVLIPRRI